MIIYFDGSIGPKNPGGVAAYGWIIKTKNEIALKSGHNVVGSGEGMTNNIAEYAGLLNALEWLTSSEIFDPNEKLIIRGDSALICNMVSKRWGWEKTKQGVKTGRWTPHSDFPVLREFLEKIRKILEEKEINYIVEWIPREENKEADELSKTTTDERNRYLQR